MNAETAQVLSGPVPGSLEPGRSVESQIANDMVRRTLFIIPLFLAFGAIGWGWPGVTAVLIATAVFVINFLLAAAIMSTAARISGTALVGAAMFGFLFRLLLITGLLITLRNVSWVARTPLGISLIVMYLVMLVWETRYISGSLAFPALKPKKKD